MSKFRNVKTNGYDSKAEAGRAYVLRLLQRAGRITDLQEQVPFEIVPKQGKERSAKYIADFTYMMDGEFVVEDVKGVRTPIYVLKRKLMKLVHGITIKEVA